jgi:ABC-type polysaccharide/polyol phosphate transport system ATPase subunit
MHIEKFRQNGTTILLILPTMAKIKALYQRAAWLEHSHLREVGQVQTVIQSYRQNRT